MKLESVKLIVRPRHLGDAGHDRVDGFDVVGPGVGHGVDGRKEVIGGNGREVAS